MKTYQVVENGKPLIENELEKPTPTGKEVLLKTCLLYTSDAADD